MKKNISAFLLISLGVFLSSCSEQKSSQQQTLNIYNWDGVMAPDTVSNFEVDYSTKVNYDLYASNEEMFAKLQAGAEGYDLIFPSDYMTDIMIKEDMLLKLDFENIPNYKYVDSAFKDLPFDSKNEYSVPFQYSAIGIAVNTKKVTEFETSWDILFDEKYKGRISMLDDTRYGMVPALKKLGYSINTTSEEELNQAKQLMQEQKELVKAYSSDTYRELLNTGEVWIALGYTGDVYQVMQTNPDLTYFIPEEGTALAIESMVIPKGAGNKRRAEEFINYILKPSVHSSITNSTQYAIPNIEAVKFVKSEIYNDKSIFLDFSTLSNSQYINDVGEATLLYDRVWSEIKAN